MKNRNVWIVIGVAVVLVAIVGLVALGLVLGFGHHTALARPMMRGYYPMVGYSLGRGILGLLFWLVLIGLGALVIAAIVRLASRGRTPSAGQTLPPARQEESAMEILRRRYARGEINREEFDLMKETLTGQAPSQTPTEGSA